MQLTMAALASVPGGRAGEGVRTEIPVPFTLHECRRSSQENKQRAGNAVPRSQSTSPPGPVPPAHNQRRVSRDVPDTQGRGSARGTLPSQGTILSECCSAASPPRSCSSLQPLIY